jgi:hypothetical protein
MADGQVLSATLKRYRGRVMTLATVGIRRRCRPPIPSTWAMTTQIDSIRRGVPAGLEEIAQLGRTLWRRLHSLVNAL